MRRFDVQRRRLAWVLGGVFGGLLAASGLLVMQSFERLRFEAIHGQRLLAEELVARVDRAVGAAMAVEEARPPTDYDFLVVAGERYVQRSPLSTLTPESSLPGVVGYFQVDAAGRFSTPLLPVGVEDPEAVSLTPAEYRERRAFEERLRRLLERGPARNGAPDGALTVADRKIRSSWDSDERLDAERAAPPAEVDTAADHEMKSRSAGFSRAPAGNSIYDKLNNASAAGAALMSDSAVDVATGTATLEESVEAQRMEAPAPRAQPPASQPAAQGAGRRVEAAERTREVRQVKVAPAGEDEPLVPRIEALRSAVDRFSLTRLDGRHLVAYRKVWLEGQRIQGLVIEQRQLLDSLVGVAFAGSSLARHGDLAVAFGDSVLQVYSATGGEYAASAGSGFDGSPLLRARIAPPAEALELIFNVSALPPAPGAVTLAWVAGVMVLVMVAGFGLLYRLGRDQIRLAEQQQDFVSAVSHELKTPLTSIRMYGEILKAGWADEARRQTYYDYILSESERLSRLIGNVLQLARITRSTDTASDTTAATAGRLLDQVESKVGSALAGAGLELVRVCEEGASRAVVRVDEDAFMQVMINLVDNAIKFSAHAERRAVELGCRSEGGGVELRVRDFGPGVAPGQMRRIFELFYRGGSELTRETVGTGIGLALVRELVGAMGGRVDVVNRTPGAEFRVWLPLAESPPDGGTPDRSR